MTTLQDEGQLLQQAIAGDSAALWQLLALHRKPLLAYVNRHYPPKLRGHMEPEDLIQDIHFQACRKIGQFQPQGADAFYRWLVTIARHLITDAYRRFTASKRGGPQAMLEENDDAVAGLLQDLKVYERTPSRSAMAHEFAALLQQSLAQIQPDYHMALRLYYIEGLPVPEAAARMDRTEGAFRMVLTRALKALRGQLLTASHYS